MVGDIVLLETGDMFCADGVLIEGFNLKVDESSMTGESDNISKDQKKVNTFFFNNFKDPFLLSGTKIVQGVGKMLVIGTGLNSFNGRLMINLSQEAEETPLQIKLSGIADQVAKFGFASAVLMVIILLVAYFSIGGHNVPTHSFFLFLNFLVRVWTLLMI
jgi:Ca2+-transporting ATPase